MFLAVMVMGGVLGLAAAIPVLGQMPSEESLLKGARLGNLAEVRLAVEAKINVNCQTPYGVTPLSLACDHGHDAVAEYLLEQGADPNLKDTFYKAGPMTWALSRNRVGIIRLLVQHGCKEIDSAILALIGSQIPVGEKRELLEQMVRSEHVTKAGLASAWTAAKKSEWNETLAILEPLLPEADRPKQVEPTPALAPSPGAALESWVGTYANADGNKLIIAVKEGVLTLRSELSDQALNLTTEGKDTFKAQGMEVVFARSADSKVTMRLKFGEQEQLYTRGEAKSETPADRPEGAAGGLEAGRPDYPLETRNWPGFRGTLSRGIADGATLVHEWDGETGKNIAWKVPVPGLATSSPVVWGDRVFITTAIRPSDQRGFRVGAYGDVESENFDGECQYLLMCLDLGTGEIVWQEEAARGVPKVKRHAKSSHANPTPVTDGKHVIASFGGEGVFAFDFEGEMLWSLQLGVLDSGWFYDPSYQWGFGSSPFLFEDMVILQCDVQEGSFVVAVDVATGKERWRTKRDEIPTWSSPVALVDPQGQAVVVVAGTKKSAGYDARTGEELWSLGGFSEIMVPTPQITPQSVVLVSGYAPVQPIVAMEHGARGALKMPEDRKGTSPFQWNTLRGGPYMPTPVIYRDQLFVLDNSGILSQYTMLEGKRLYRKRIRNEDATAFTASPLVSRGFLFGVSEIGVTFVVDLSKEGEVVATNRLGESVLASPAVGGDTLLIRGEKHLFAIRQGGSSP